MAGANLGLELVNTHSWYGRGPNMIDRLAPEGAELRFLERIGFGRLKKPSAGDRASLYELRDLLRRLTTSCSAEGSPTESDVAALNRFLETPVARRLEEGNLRVVPIRRDWAWATAEIAASFAELLIDGDPARVKVCSNPECRWAFYDLSKNRSRRWCFASQCGNVAKVRAYRERQRAKK